MKNNVHTLTFYPDVHCEKIMTEVFPEERLEFVASGGAAVASAPADFSVEDGKSYIVKFDCVDHEVEAANGAISNDVFSISVSGGQMSVSIAAAGSHTVSVTTCEKNICKMPSEYLPDDIGGGSGGGSGSGGGGVFTVYGSYPHIFKDADCTQGVTKAELEGMFKSGLIWVVWHDYESDYDRTALVIDVDFGSEYGIVCYLKNYAGTAIMQYLNTSEYVDDEGEG